MLWINTIILILTSIVFHRTKVLADNNKFEKAKNSLFVVVFLTFAFITGQLLVWQYFVNLGQYASTNPANAFFFVLTGLHGLHVLGGLYFLAKTTTQLIKDNYNISKVKQNIELCAIYWHFLLIVWFVLFGLMVAT